MISKFYGYQEKVKRKTNYRLQYVSPFAIGFTYQDGRKTENGSVVSWCPLEGVNRYHFDVSDELTKRIQEMLLNA